MRIIYLFTLSICFLLACKEDKTPALKTQVKTAQIAKKIDVPIDQSTSPKTMKTLDEVMGKFEPNHHEDFVIIDVKYADQSNRWMHRQAYEAFINMWNHAQKDGIQLTIKSATRNFIYQKGIWERKWTGQRAVDGQAMNETMPDHKQRALKILEYSSMPGTSRHHWGTDIDLNAFENSYFESGKGKKEYEWLQKNAAQYGFCQPYTAKDEQRPHGYNEEKWHWSYLPVANQYLQTAEQDMNDHMIKGFQGSETAVEIGVVEKYILGINQHCKK